MKPIPHNLRTFRLAFRFLLTLYEKEKANKVIYKIKSQHIRLNIAVPILSINAAYIWWTKRI